VDLWNSGPVPIIQTIQNILPNRKCKQSYTQNLLAER